MSRMVSFGVLIAIIVALGMLFLRVMWVFWLPLFLALLMALVFRPVYRWFLLRSRGSEYTAAAATTTAILALVLAPLAWVCTLAVMQSLTLVSEFEMSRFTEKAAATRSSLGLDMPFPNDFKAIEAAITRLDDLPTAPHGATDHVAIVGNTLNVIWRLQRRLEDPTGVGELANDQLLPPWERDPFARDLWTNAQMREVWRNPELLEGTDQEEYRNLASDPLVAELARREDVTRFWNDPLVRPLVELSETKIDDSSYSPYRADLQRVQIAFLNFRQRELGDPFRAWVLNLLNPSDAELTQARTDLLDWVNRSLLEITIPTTQLMTDMMILGGVMILGIFYFFADGPNMVSTAMQLSPLDQRYLRQLLEQFDSTARAVVTANLVNSLAHGVAAAMGYFWVADSWILLSVLTMLLALVPFIGAACVWMPVAMWLWLYDDAPGKAIFLAVYGSTVLTAIDYGLRPLLLHGQANIHPLLAFMSVLGGVQVLGPIGILLGPIIVLLLQTLLTMLQTELSHLDEGSDTPLVAGPTPERQPRDELAEAEA